MNTKRFNADNTQVMGDYQTGPVRDLYGNWSLPMPDECGSDSIITPTKPNKYITLPSGAVIKNNVAFILRDEKDYWFVFFSDYSTTHIKVRIDETDYKFLIEFLNLST